MTLPPLQIGLLLDSFDQPAWVRAMLRRIQKSDYASIALVVLNDAPRPAARRGLLSRLVSSPDTLLYRLYRMYEDWRFRAQPDAFEMSDAKALLAGAPVLKAKPQQSNGSDWLRDEDIEKIKEHDLDVLVRQGFRSLRGSILDCPKYGVWSYHNGTTDVNRDGLSALWDVVENRPTTDSDLRILADDHDHDTILCRSHAATHQLSVNLTDNTRYWKNLSFLPRKLKELHDQGADEFFARAKAQDERMNPYSSKPPRKPRNFELLGPLLKHQWRYLKRKVYETLFVDQWFLMFDLCDEVSTSFWRFKRLLPPKDRFWADPHVVHRDDRYYIFIEELRYARDKGHISLIEMDASGNCTEPKKILERDYHLSYPFILEWQGQYYMIPDSIENRTIEVYRCTEFPDRWELHTVLMQDVAAVDTTLHHHEGRWWLFANMKESEGAPINDELFLFHADNPLSREWIPHPKNPIVSDVRRSRPAGRIFEYNGNTYRPAQDCSGSYGNGLRIHQILTLSPTDYEEREVTFTEPHWDKNIKGVHTFGHEHKLTIIDAKLKRLRLF